MADRISVHGWNDFFRMRLVHPHLAEVIIVLVDDGDFVRLLQQLDVEVPKDVGHGILETLVVGVRKCEAR